MYTSRVVFSGKEHNLNTCVRMFRGKLPVGSRLLLYCFLGSKRLAFRHILPEVSQVSTGRRDELLNEFLPVGRILTTGATGRAGRHQVSQRHGPWYPTESGAFSWRYRRPRCMQAEAERTQ